MNRFASIIVLMPVLACPTPVPAGTECEPAWSDQFVPTGGDMQGFAYHMVSHDDGRGPALFMGGTFETVAGGELTVNHVARWDGKAWSTLGSGLNDDVRAMLVFDDGSGPALYVGGVFTMAGDVEALRIAKWDGRQWSAVGDGFDASVLDLAVFDDGSGPALYAAGGFQNSGAASARRVARWNGLSWVEVGGGADDTAWSLDVFDDGSGPALYVGGTFYESGGMPAAKIARWDGIEWTEVGGGFPESCPGCGVYDLELFDDGNGTALYAGGSFSDFELGVSSIAKWDGFAWSPLLPQLGSAPLITLSGKGITELHAVDLGTGPMLCVGGLFSLPDDPQNQHIAGWDGTSWHGLGEGIHSTGGIYGIAFPVMALSQYDSGTGAMLYASGPFGAAGDAAAANIATWDGTDWSALQLGNGDGLEGTADDMVVFDDGTGEQLYVAGAFESAGGQAIRYFGRFDGAAFHEAAPPLSAFASALAIFDDGGGESLYVGGSFTYAGGLATSRIARWDGASWSPLGAGFDSRVNDLTTFDDGTGSALFAAGSFDYSGSISLTLNGIAKWDGQAWSALGTGLGGISSPIGQCMAVHDDGTGPALYLGGRFPTAGGVTVNHIAKWDGSLWSPLGEGFTAPPRGVSDVSVLALASYDDGSGAKLYAGGRIGASGPIAFNGIARWDGRKWDDVAGGVIHVSSTLGARELKVVDLGNGPVLMVGGTFDHAGGRAATNLATWDGSSWSSFQGGTSGSVSTIAARNEPSGPALYLSGLFQAAGGVPSGSFARWGCPLGPDPDLDGDGDVDGFDLALLLGAWGQCPRGGAPGSCPADLDGNGIVNGFDLAILLGAWG